MRATPRTLGHFCDILGGVGAVAAGGGVLPATVGALRVAIGASGLAEQLRAQGADAAAAALERFARAARRKWRDWADVGRMDPGAAEGAIADFDAYVEAEGAALAPTPDRVAALRAALIDAADPAETRPGAPPAPSLARRLAAQVADDVLRTAAARAPAFYADRAERAVSRDFLRRLVEGAFLAMLETPEFAAALQPAVLDLLIRRMGEIARTQHDERADIAAQGALTREALAALGAELRDSMREALPEGLSLRQAEAILVRFGEHGVPPDPDRIAEILRGKAEEMRTLQARLRNAHDDPGRVAEMRAEAAAMIDAGDFDAARAHLAQARHVDRAEALSILRRIAQRRASEVATLARLAELERLRLDYAAEAACWMEAFDLTPETDAAARWRLARRSIRAQTDLGREFGDNAALEAAVELAREVTLKLAPRSQRPFDWARSQADLGEALALLGEREQGVATLEGALRAYRAALSVRTRAITPAGWAETTANLGRVLHLIGARETGQKRLRQAVEAFRSVLRARPRDADPEVWARTQNHLGNALKLIGQRAHDSIPLRRAIDAYEAALEVFDRVDHPREWAMSMSNLAGALRTLGAWERDPELLRASVETCRSALLVRRPDRAPLDWATTQSALANALQTLGQMTGDDAATIEALSAYRAALELRRREMAPLDWAMTRGNLGVARMALAERASATRAAPPARMAAPGVCARLAARDLRAAEREMRAVGHLPYAAYYAERLEEARALARRVRPAGGKRQA